jgi:hypothetical protein
MTKYRMFKKNEEEVKNVREVWNQTQKYRHWSCGLWRRVHLKVHTNVSEERAASVSSFNPAIVGYYNAPSLLTPRTEVCIANKHVQTQR